MSNQYVNSKKLIFQGHNADHDENHIISNNDLVIEAKNTKVEGDIEIKYGIKINDSQGIKDINGNNAITLSANGSEIVIGKAIDFNNVAVSNFSGGGGGGGGLPITGDGNITIGTGNISITNGTITSTGGDIQTGGTADIVSGRNFILDGDTIQKRTENLGVITLTEYTATKDCARKSSNNNFTTQQTFADDILMSGSNKTLNNSQGSIIGGTGNIETIICGTVDCDNGGSNSVSAKEYNLRTSSATIAGWSLEQGGESEPAEQVDKVLQIKAGEAGGYITITPTDFAGTDPAIVLDPNDTANGGRIYAGNFTLGTTANRYRLTQDLTGPLNDTLQISAPTANSKVEFRDNSNNVILDVNKTAIELGTNIPIKFDNYEFRPQEITYNFTGAVLDANPATLFNSLTTDFTRTNDGATVKLNALGEAVYILSIDAGSSSGGTIGSSRFMCFFPYMVSANASGSFSFSGNFLMNTTPAAGFAEPTIEGDGTGGPVGSTNFSFAFSSITGVETYNGVVKITRLSY